MLHYFDEISNLYSVQPDTIQLIRKELCEEISLHYAAADLRC